MTLLEIESENSEQVEQEEMLVVDMEEKRDSSATLESPFITIEYEEDNDAHGTREDIQKWWETRKYKSAEDVPKPQWEGYVKPGGLPEKIDSSTEQFIRWYRTHRVTATAVEALLQLFQDSAFDHNNIPTSRYLVGQEEDKRFPAFGIYSFTDPATGSVLTQT